LLRRPKALTAIIFSSFTNTNIDKKRWKMCLGNVKN